MESGLFVVAVLIGGVVLLGLLAIQWWFLAHVLRQNGRLLVRVEDLDARLRSDDEQEGPGQSPNGGQPHEGLPIGAPAPGFSLSGLYGEVLTLDALRAPGKPVLLLFTDPNCGPCNALLPQIGTWQQEHAHKVNISLISRGTAEDNHAKSSEHGITSMLLQKDWEISESYEVKGTPSAVLVHPDGTIGSPVVSGPEAIDSLVAQTVGAPRPQLPMQPQPAAHHGEGEPCPNCGKVHAASPQRTGVDKIGQPAPEVKLKNLNGKTVRLKDFRGQKVLVLFWDPGCGFCQQMLEDLKDFEANPPAGAPKILVVSRGTREANKELGLRSTVLEDPQFTAGPAFGTYGTPTAVLVDEQGNIASGVAQGAPPVFELVTASLTQT